MPLVSERIRWDRLITGPRFPQDYPPDAIRVASPDGDGHATFWRLKESNGWFVQYEFPSTQESAEVIYLDAGGAWEAHGQADDKTKTVRRLERTAPDTTRAPRDPERMAAFLRGRMNGE